MEGERREIERARITGVGTPEHIAAHGSSAVYHLGVFGSGRTAKSTRTFGTYFGTSARFWLNLQVQYDLDIEFDRDGARIQRDVIPRAI